MIKRIYEKEKLKDLDPNKDKINHNNTPPDYARQKHS